LNGPVLVIVEGANDIEFLLRLSAKLHLEMPHAPDLGQWQAQNRLALIPVGGGAPASWPDRFRSLHLPEFHLYDREQMPETGVRQRAIDRVNARPGCHGAVTAKRAMENYLHPCAIAAAGGGDISYGDTEPVCSLLARCWHTGTPNLPAWEDLPRRTARRLAAQAKRWLNTIAVEHMTAGLLAERDPAGEVLGWLRAIGELVESGSCQPGPALSEARI
jgi:putative ATP-dependent endonuclease of OLD family